MSTKEIVQHPADVLNKESIRIKDLEEAKKIAEDLVDSLSNSKVPGAGLAAPQIGINKRMFVARRYYNLGEEEKYEDIIVINPTITKYSNKKVKSLEGCLSIFNTYGYVERSKSIKVEYTNLKGEKETLKTGGFLSTVIQHEFDHIEGILFIDKLIDDKTYTEKEVEEMAKRN